MHEEVPNKPLDYYTCPFKKSKLDRWHGYKFLLDNITTRLTTHSSHQLQLICHCLKHRHVLNSLWAVLQIKTIAWI
jgi:hypothetical protein